jgi:hypothetical protein
MTQNFAAALSELAAYVKLSDAVNNRPVVQATEETRDIANWKSFGRVSFSDTLPGGQASTAFKSA